MRPPADQIERDITEGLVVLGRQLRKWRNYAALHSLAGCYRDKDGRMVTVSCDAEDHVHIRYDGHVYDLTERL